MNSLGPELVLELLPIALYSILAVALTAGGIAAEYASVQHLGSGEMLLAAWLAALGSVMLYAGVYGLGYRKVLARVV